MSDRTITIRVAGENDAAEAMRAAADEIRNLGAMPPVKLGVELEPPKADPEFWRAVREDLAKEKLAIRVEAQIESAKNLDEQERDRFANTEPEKLPGDVLGATTDNGLKGALGSVEKINTSLRLVAKTAASITVFTEATNVALGAVSLSAALAKGEYEGQVKAAKEMEKTIGGLPVVGGKFLAIGQKINKFLIDQLGVGKLIDAMGIKRLQGEGKVTEEIKRQTAEQEKQIELMEKRLKRRQEETRNAEGVVGKVGADKQLSEEDAFAAKIAADRKALDEALKTERGKDGKLTETGKDIKLRAEERINNAIVEFEQRRMDRFKSDVVEMEAARLRSIGNVREAERLELEDSLRKREEAAAKVGASELDAQQRVSDFKRTEFDKETRRQEEERTRKDADDRRAQQEAANDFADKWRESIASAMEKTDAAPKLASNRLASAVSGPTAGFESLAAREAINRGNVEKDIAKNTKATKEAIDKMARSFQDVARALQASTGIVIPVPFNTD